MDTDRREVRDEIKRTLSEPWRVAELLGLTEGAKRQATGLLVRCPVHNERNPSCSVTAADGTLRVKCFACPLSGDVFDLIAAARGLDRKRDFPAVVEAGRALAGIAPATTPPPKRQTSNPGQVAAWWDALPPVDAECWDYLRSRGLEEASDLCRYVPDIAPGDLEWMGKSGYRLAQALRDAAGTVVAIQVRQITGHDFRIVGQASAGVFGQVERLEAAKLVVICEGFADTLAAITAQDAGSPSAVIGIAGTQATAALATMPLEGKRVLVAMDADAAGDKAAEAIRVDLEKRRAVVIRARPTKGKDLCDIITAGDSLREFLTASARPDLGFRNFEQRIKGDRARRIAIGKRLVKLGHTFIDSVTGGLRPDDKLLIGAKQGAGKTEIASVFAMYAAMPRDKAPPKRVHFFALEADNGEIEQRIKWRMLSSMAWSALPPHQRQRLNFTDWGNGLIDDITDPWEDACDRLLSDQFKTLHTYYRKGGFTREDMARIASGLKGETDLIILDHLHYVDIPDANENRGMKLLLQSIVDACEVAGAPLVLLAHLRKLERKGAPLVPQLDDFRGTSDIGGIVKRAFTIARANDQTPEEPHFIPTYIRVAKNRPDGSRCQYVGLVNFDIRSNTYGTKYTVGKLVKDETAFEAVPAEKIPPWAIEQAKPPRMFGGTRHHADQERE